MKEPTEQFERLVSRFLDDECSAAERKQLQAEIRRDGDAEAFFEETAALDREFGRAIRAAIATPAAARHGQPHWFRLVRMATLSAAACLAWFIWRPDAGPQSSITNSGQSRPQFASWFAPQPAAGDTLAQPTRSERPEVLLDQSDRQWIVVPGQRPGEFLVVEVKCVKTRKIPVQADF